LLYGTTESIFVNERNRRFPPKPIGTTRNETILTPMIHFNEGTKSGTYQVLKELAERTFRILSALEHELDAFRLYMTKYFPDTVLPENLSVSCVKILPFINCDGKGLSLTKAQLQLLISDLIAAKELGGHDDDDEQSRMLVWLQQVEMLAGGFHLEFKANCRNYLIQKGLGKLSMLAMAVELGIYSSKETDGRSNVLPKEKLSIKHHSKVLLLSDNWLNGALLSLFNYYLNKNGKAVSTVGKLKSLSLKCISSIVTWNPSRVDDVDPNPQYTALIVSLRLCHRLLELEAALQTSNVERIHCSLRVLVISIFAGSKGTYYEAIIQVCLHFFFFLNFLNCFRWFICAMLTPMFLFVLLYKEI